MTKFLNDTPDWQLWLFFLIENALIVLGVLAWGNRLLQRPRREMFRYTSHQWRLCIVTFLLNTLVTIAGYQLWKHGYIRIHETLSWRVLTDALALFLVMDLLMYLFHYLIHQTFLYRLLHRLHHEATDPVPIDLFVLHPLETLSFGALWLLVLLPFNMNLYGILIYLTINVVFGMTGHLGMEPLPENMRQWPVLKYLGTSTFHHGHHRQEHFNYGFYTSIWDRLFGTFRQENGHR
ncbi:sterol desaturase family protein [Chitinophaga oryzae]|uniref:Sterol desaturase family protein n=1 Tax=Chitinophaga oryzae TaxID=2725414 RepID=A0AAE6ZLC6_9BACT|nr:sterol desaturase family protein [Chitinophaga oryzae]QJB34063.1 sterol desaturase family protein [Chitinophaga oryzae]QJB40591.1 sterol desaturase family protein [Chitinophaga oryzae]